MLGNHDGSIRPSRKLYQFAPLNPYLELKPGDYGKTQHALVVQSTMSSNALRPIDRLFRKGTFTGSSDAQLLDRFVHRRDEAAFEALVCRHGPLVLAVCRGVLRNDHDAEDAFQTTFLTLARKAHALRADSSLGAWLHRVGLRIAVEARQRVARTQRLESCGVSLDMLVGRDPAPEERGHGALHEEIDRLPEKYRAPIVLCELEELTRDEAASRLGWPPGTVAGRLARARALLRDRLVRRKFVTTGTLVGAVGIPRISLATLPHGLIERATRHALIGLRTPAVAASLFLKPIAAAIFLAAAGVALHAMTPAIAVQDTEPDDAPRGAPSSAKTRAAGSVLFQDGKPADGVRVLFSTFDSLYARAHVRSETRTGPGGEFELSVPSMDGRPPAADGVGIVWAYRPGSLIASTVLWRGSHPSGLRDRMVVGPPGRAAFRVLDPDGRPVAGARIAPTAIDRTMMLFVPEELIALLGAETLTDADGRAVMTSFLPEEVAGVRVSVKGYGQQERSFGFGNVGVQTKVIRLQHVGRITGRLVGDPAAVRRRPLRLSSFSPPGDPHQAAFNRELTTDDEGRFEIPEIAVGHHGVRTLPRYDFPWYAFSQGGLSAIEPGKTVELIMPLKPAIHVRGEIRERGTGKPIAGVRIKVAPDESGLLTTDEHGRYECYIPPDLAVARVLSVPPGYMQPEYTLPQVRPAADVTELTLPPVELTRAGAVAGTAIDAHGEPIAGADVMAKWISEEGRPGTGPHDLSVRTDTEGRFVFEGVAEGVDVELTAHRYRMHTPEPVVSRVGADVAPILRLDSTRSVALQGRVLDAAGRPIKGAAVRIRSQKRVAPGGQVRGNEPVPFEGIAVLLTDADGRFQTPKDLDVDGEYAAYVSAEGRASARTAWIMGYDKIFPDLTVPAEPPRSAGQ